jgi:hypothetical protein
MIRKFASRLYDERKNCQTFHHGMNKLRVIVATSRDASLVRLSTSEAALIELTQIWTAWHVAKPHIPPPLEYRRQKGQDSLQPVYFEGPVSADLLQDLVCSCKGKSPCKKPCACFEEILVSTDLCFSQESEWCKHA